MPFLQKTSKKLAKTNPKPSGALVPVKQKPSRALVPVGHPSHHGLPPDVTVCSSHLLLKPSRDRLRVKFPSAILRHMAYMAGMLQFAAENAKKEEPILLLVGFNSYVSAYDCLKEN